MNILVIGNGFDIAHGLPTKYGNFLEFVKAFKRFKYSPDNTSSQYYKYFQALTTSKQTLYAELNELITDNIWLKYFIDIYEERKADGKERWIDFESEISSVIQIFDAALKTLNEQFRIGKSYGHMETWQAKILNAIFFKNIHENKFDKTIVFNEKKQAINDLNNLTRCLEIYLSDYISIDTCSQLQDIANLEIHRVLSFNYTDTYKQIYDKSAGSIKYDFIHGKADIANDVNSCNLVLGIDEYLSGEAKDKDNEFIQFKKFFQRIYKGTGCLYTDWVSLINDNNKRFAKASPPINNVYIYGHSLDVTDADIFRRLILLDNTITTIFYHSKESMGSQIANLVKVIGEDELIKRTDGSNRSIIFKQSSSEKL